MCHWFFNKSAQCFFKILGSSSFSSCFYTCVENDFVDFEECCGFMTFVRRNEEMTDWHGLTFVSSPDVILCGRLGLKHQQLINFLFPSSTFLLFVVPMLFKPLAIYHLLLGTSVEAPLAVMVLTGHASLMCQSIRVMCFGWLCFLGGR